ncbi:hypothetical protein ACFY2R_01060 [Micromonospora olivasterospora]|uniref:Tellurite resistance protein TerB n=1 Tax=Micromonospora olivasterospora TaxID=1880 RepID=A0A562ICM3_MICOL|nr:hypothetical protein [Micromonospora olivasterospora]TWH68737.1 hypothetical protein JD77_03735 [Micromonospora olivasterospora]
MEQWLTDEERLTLKTGAFGAVFLVSNAEPGMFALIRESFAASDVMSEASGELKKALTTGPLPELPRDSVLDIESVVLPALRRAVAILREKASGDVAGYRSLVLAAAERVARADRGVAPVEAQVIDRIRDALAESA